MLKRAFYILFAFYFLSLAVVPCSDNEPCDDGCGTEMTHHESENDHSEETCTPFCVCSCCAAHIVVNTIDNQIVIASIEVRSYCETPTSKVQGAILPIWQPPKLA